MISKRTSNDERRSERNRERSTFFDGSTFLDANHVEAAIQSSGAKTRNSSVSRNGDRDVVVCAEDRTHGYGDVDRIVRRRSEAANNRARKGRSSKKKNRTSSRNKKTTRRKASKERVIVLRNTIKEDLVEEFMMVFREALDQAIKQAVRKRPKRMKKDEF